MKVYLSTAITRGRREYVDAVKTISEAVQETGADVLNERVTDPNFPTPQTDRADTMREIRTWLEQADTLIAEATISSTGVGCEFTSVLMRGKPVLLIYDAQFGFRISDWVTMNPDENVYARPYRDHDEIAALVKDFLASIKG